MLPVTKYSMCKMSLMLCRLLVKSISQESGVFEGRPDNLVFTHSTKLLASNTYYDMGKLLAMTLTQGGPGMQAMAQPLYEYWTEIPVTEAQLSADLIADPDMKETVHQVYIVTISVSSVYYFPLSSLLQPGNWAGQFGMIMICMG